MDEETRQRVQDFIARLYEDPVFTKPSRAQVEKGFSPEALAGSVLLAAQRSGVNLV